MPIPIPAGASHPWVRELLDLRRSPGSAPQLALVEGLSAHEFLLRTGCAVETFVWAEELAFTDAARSVAERMAAVAERSCTVSARTMRRLSARDRQDGFLSAARLPSRRLTDLELGDSALVVVADGLQTPWNLGTLARTLDAVAGTALLVTNRRTPVSHPSVVAGSKGTILTVPHVETSVDDAAEWLLGNGFAVRVADPDAEQDFHDADVSGRVAFVLGNERYGIGAEWDRPGLERVRVPMRGLADSLNVAVCGAVLLYDAAARAGR